MRLKEVSSEVESRALPPGDASRDRFPQSKILGYLHLAIVGDDMRGAHQIRAPGLIDAQGLSDFRRNIAGYKLHAVMQPPDTRRARIGFLEVGLHPWDSNARRGDGHACKAGGVGPVYNEIGLIIFSAAIGDVTGIDVEIDLAADPGVARQRPAAYRRIVEMRPVHQRLDGSDNAGPAPIFQGDRVLVQPDDEVPLALAYDAPRRQVDDLLIAIAGTRGQEPLRG